MILFKKIKWKNLLSTGNIFTEVYLNTHGTTLIVGENGAGKSTLLDALTFVLFGKPFRKINKPQLLNSITKKELVVEIEFDIGTTEYKIVRGIKPDIFEVYKNSVLLNQDDKSRDYQTSLEKNILKVNYKSFCQIVVLGSATFKPFMQLTTSERRAIIEDLLDLQIFTTMNEILKRKIIANNDDIIFCNSNKRILEEKIKLMREHYVEIQNNNDSMIEEKKIRIQDTLESLAILETQSKEKKKEIEDLEVTIEGEEIFKEKIQNLSSLKHKIEAKLSILNKEVSFFNQHDDCPTCKQPIDVNFKKESVENRITQIEKINNGLDKLIEQYEEINNKIKSIMHTHNVININNMELHRINTKINSFLDYKETLENEIKKINKNIESFDNSKMNDIQTSIEEQKKKLTDLTEQKQLMSITGTLLKDGGIKARIIKQYIPIINKFINKYLSQMEFMCQFDLNEEFDETIKSRFRDEFSYDSFSEGEKQKIDISLLFTWRAIAKLRNSINTNILIFDEILDSSLDTNSLDYFMNIIKSFTKGENIFIISHKEQLADRFENFMRFEKHKNFSKLVSE